MISVVEERINEFKSLIGLPGVDKIQISKYWLNENRVIFSIDIELEEGE